MPNSNYDVAYRGEVYVATYSDAQRLMRLQTEVLTGEAQPQEFTFREGGVEWEVAREVTVELGSGDEPQVTPQEVYRDDQA
ncbi:hypothetical protein [Leifsonia virtsii]|uniref:Uncharacterized protein n=1 Tax=Leifsonia virtsii TaxID=3035915 RepID=A0ABT8J306_9MICO|nr:hypothetical protein [Leifsonia virtsii]MDN4599445.1 hypothetical protein [Leifsonia virtsii]